MALHNSCLFCSNERHEAGLLDNDDDEDDDEDDEAEPHRFHREDYSPERDDDQLYDEGKRRLIDAPFPQCLGQLSLLASIRW